MAEFAALRVELAELRGALGRAEATERERSDVIRLAASRVKERCRQPFKLQNREQDFAEWSDRCIRYLKAKLGQKAGDSSAS